MEKMQIGDFDELSESELAYLNSGGKTDLGIGQQTDESAPSEAEQQPAAPQVTAPENAAPDANASLEDDEDEIDDEIIVGPDGKLRAKNGKFVSHRALHKEREKHKATKAEMQTLRDKLSRGEERLAILNEAFQGSQGQKPNVQQPQQPANPYDEATIDPQEDIFGAFKQMQRRAEFNFKQQNEVQQMQTARDTFQRVTQAYHADARQFMQKEPSFEAAYKHLVAGRHAELQSMGMTDDAQRNAYIAQEETQLVVQAMQSGKSPSQVIYEFAKARGFAPSQSSAPAPAPMQNASAAVQKIQQVRNGQQAAQSLSNVGGAAAKTLTMDTLANMSDDEFAAAVDGMSKAQIRQLMGG